MSSRRDLDDKMSITPSQMALIFMVNYHEKITLSDIAKNLNISKSAVTQLVDGLVRLDLLKKINDENDRRINYLSLTEKSKIRLDKMHDCFIEKISKIFDVLSDNDLLELNRITSKLLNKKG